jgi:hypothetical protein
MRSRAIGGRHRLATGKRFPVAFRNSSSAGSMRFLVSGPVPSQLCRLTCGIWHPPPGLRDRRSASEGATPTKAQIELQILWVAGVLRHVLGFEMVEIGEEHVEAVTRRQKLVAVAEMVLPNWRVMQPSGLSRSASVGSFSDNPSLRPRQRGSHAHPPSAARGCDGGSERCLSRHCS